MNGHHQWIVLLTVLSMGFFTLCQDAMAMGTPVKQETADFDEEQAACVILLHGMGRTHRSMEKMAYHLANEGYQVVNLDYPSTEASIEALSAGIVSEAVQSCRLKSPSAPIHFVTHSLGGILVRQYLQTHRLPPGSRVVMLSPPNQGSEIADLLKDFFLYRDQTAHFLEHGSFRHPERRPI